MNSNEGCSLFADSLYASHVEAAAMAALPSVAYQSAGHELSLHSAACDPNHIAKEGKRLRKICGFVFMFLLVVW